MGTSLEENNKTNKQTNKHCRYTIIQWPGKGPGKASYPEVAAVCVPQYSSLCTSPWSVCSYRTNDAYTTAFSAKSKSGKIRYMKKEVWEE